MNINFFQTPNSLKKRKELKIFLKKIAKKEGFEIISLNVVFCTDEVLFEMNKKYLNHKYYTDIITFDYSVKASYKIEGDLYISKDRVKENALNHQTSYKKEIHRVIFHGLLHLCGLKDKKPNEIKEMRDKEDHYLKLYGV